MRRSLIFCALGAVAAAAIGLPACAGGTVTDTGAGGAGGAAGCPVGLTDCGFACVDATVDPGNCGGCGVSCAPGQLCSAGKCVVTCQAGTLLCGGKCVDPATSSAFCGAKGDCLGPNAGKPCAAGESCQSGQCTSGCPAGSVVCSGVCLDPATSNTHCGATGDCAGANAGEACDPGFNCVAGQCVLSCQMGLIDCNGTCTDPTTSNLFCGATGDCTGANAGEACDPGFVCDGMGSCALSCQAGLIDCAGTCTDPTSSDTHCGASGDCTGANAGQSCGPTKACKNGACVPIAIPTGTFLVNEWNQSKQHVWTPGNGMVTLFHTTQANDMDCNASEGSPLVWFVEHFNDHFGNYTHGSANGFVGQLSTPYAYPKHVAVFENSIVVMSRNDATLFRYDTNGNVMTSKATNGNTGQGIATDGTSLFVSVWSGAVSSFQKYDASLVLQQTFPNPTGMGADNNVVDLVYEPSTGHFFGLVTTGEGGTQTNGNRIVEFVMGGAVVQSFTLGIQMDGIGRNACP